MKKQLHEMSIGEFLREKGYRGERATPGGRVYRGNWSHQKMRNTKVWHRRIVESAIQEGKIDHHPDYPIGGFDD